MKKLMLAVILACATSVVGATQRKVKGDWCSLGTSISWYNNNVNAAGGRFTRGYQSRVMDVYAFAGFVNCAINGGTIVSQANANVPKATYYTIEHGINDWGNSTPIGTIEDYTGNTGNTTFYANYRKLVDKIRAANPTATIILCTPRRGYDFNGFLPENSDAEKNGIKLGDYVEAVRAIAEVEKFQVADFFEKCGTDAELESLSIDVALHPNDDGYQRMADELMHAFDAVFAGATDPFVMTYTWNGPTSTAASWTDSANWLVDGQPTNAYPASSDDTAVFADGTVAVIDLALDSAAGGSAKMTVGEGANVTIKSTAQTVSGFYCYPTIGANATLTFDHVKLVFDPNKMSGYLKMSADTSCLRFVNGAEYSPAWMGWDYQFNRGLWWFEDATFDFTDLIIIGHNANLSHHDIVLVNTTAGSSLKGKNLSYQYGVTGYLYITNSVLRMREDASGMISVGDWTSSGRGIVLSGDESLVSSYMLQLGKNAALEFDYGRTDRAAFQVGVGGFAPDATARLIVDVSNVPDSAKEVPLVSTTGTMTIPEGWLTMDPSCVTASEYVKRIYVSDDGKTLMATLAKPSTDTAPSGRVVIEDAVAGAHEKAVKAVLDDRGAGAESTSITIALYSDAERTLLVRSVKAAEDRTDSSYEVTVSFGDLVLDTPYYVRATLSNNLGEEKVIDADFTFQYPLPSGSEFSWCGWGDGVSWTDPANWGVREGYPASSTQTAAFPENAIAAFDVADLAGVSDVKIKVGTDTVLSITNAAAELKTFTCSPTIGANAVMIFDHVKLSGFPASSSTSSRYLFVNGAEYSPGWISGKGNSAGAWVFENSVFGFTDQMPLGQGGYMQDVVLVNSTAGGDSKGRNMQLAGFLCVSNSVLRMDAKNSGNIGVKDSTAYERGIIISGDESLVTPYLLTMGKKTLLEFDYGRKDRAAIQIGEGGFAPDATAKLVVRLPKSLKRSCEVPLVSCTGTMTIPEAWLALNPESVEAPKQLTGLAVKEVDGVRCLMATFTLNKGMMLIIR